MKILNKRSIFIPLVGIIVFVLLVASYGVYRHFTSPADLADNSDGNITVTPAPEELSDSDAAAKQAYIDAQKEPSNTATPGTESPQSTDVEIQSSTSTNSVTITTKLHSIGDGSCELSIKNGTRTYSSTAEVIYQPSYSTCAGFTVPISELGTGIWSVSLKATSLDGSASDDSISVEVN